VVCTLVDKNSASKNALLCRNRCFNRMLQRSLNPCRLAKKIFPFFYFHFLINIYLQDESWMQSCTLSHLCMTFYVNEQICESSNLILRNFEWNIKAKKEWNGKAEQFYFDGKPGSCKTLLLCKVKKRASLPSSKQLPVPKIFVVLSLRLFRCPLSCIRSIDVNPLDPGTESWNMSQH